MASKDNLEQRPAREVIAEQLSHLPRKEAFEPMDSLVDCSLVEAELGWQQPNSLEEAFEKYVQKEDIRL